MPETVKIRTVPNARKSFCAGAYGDAVKIKISSPAVDGKANACLIDFLSGLLEVPKNSIKILRGQTSREKLLEISGTENVREKLLKSAKI